MDEDGATVVAENIRCSVEKYKIIWSGQNLQCTVTIGVATAIPNQTDISEPTVLIDNADKALYQAKEKGRNQIYVFKQDYS